MIIEKKNNKLVLEHIDINIIDRVAYIPSFLELNYSSIKNAGLGIFAKDKIPKGKFLGNYVGEILDGNNLEKNQYIFDTIIGSEKKKIDGVDLNKSNWTRFMNSSLGDDKIMNVICITCNNKDIYNKSNSEKICLNGYIIFYAKKDIKVGEELLFDYGLNYNNRLKGANNANK